MGASRRPIGRAGETGAIAAARETMTRTRRLEDDTTAAADLSRHSEPLSCEVRRVLATVRAA
ncbi:hypothetical protein [Methylobacterium aquaticum]|uniref:hypothetical protein n=1 Tax=Methylobacterium aquaticum TaxID=270351 RepID=UPI001932FA87|nr:hypothetical protein [Methylobacterium aquaticum]QRE74781.1 hypothetical protein F1D61_15305 [Methylobacterium aquaticum]